MSKKVLKQQTFSNFCSGFEAKRAFICIIELGMWTRNSLKFCNNSLSTHFLNVLKSIVTHLITGSNEMKLCGQIRFLRKDNRTHAKFCCPFYLKLCRLGKMKLYCICFAFVSNISKRLHIYCTFTAVVSNNSKEVSLIFVSKSLLSRNNELLF